MSFQYWGFILASPARHSTSLFPESDIIGVAKGDNLHIEPKHLLSHLVALVHSHDSCFAHWQMLCIRSQLCALQLLPISSDDHNVSSENFQGLLQALFYCEHWPPHTLFSLTLKLENIYAFSFLYRFHKLVGTLFKKMFSVYRLCQLKIIHYLCFYILFEGYWRLSKTSLRSHTNIILAAVTGGFSLSGKWIIYIRYLGVPNLNILF